MDAPSSAMLRALLAAQAVGSLGTLRDSRDGAEPSVSMVPVAWLAGGADALIHISTLAAHTRDLQRHPRASLMLMAPRADGDDPLALPRLTLQVDASVIDPDSPDHERAAAAYLARFAAAGQTFVLADFALWRLRPRAARLVAGFGRAHAVDLQQLALALA